MRILYITLMYNVQVYEMIKICTYFIKQNKKCLISVKLESQKFMLLCQLLKFHSMLTDSLQVQTGSKYNVSLDASYSCKERDRTLRVLFVIDFISLVTYQDVFFCFMNWRKNIHNGNCQKRVCPFLICCQNINLTNKKKNLKQKLL